MGGCFSSQNEHDTQESQNLVPENWLLIPVGDQHQQPGSVPVERSPCQVIHHCFMECLFSNQCIGMFGDEMEDISISPTLLLLAERRKEELIKAQQGKPDASALDQNAITGADGNEVAGTEADGGVVALTGADGSVVAGTGTGDSAVAETGTDDSTAVV